MFLHSQYTKHGRLLLFIGVNENNTNDAFTNLRGLIIMSKKIATLITDLLKGVDITGFKSIRNDLKNAGANYKDEEVVVSNNIVTSRFPDDIPAFNRESLKLLAE